MNRRTPCRAPTALVAPSERVAGAFTLIEVMIALSLFFMATFAILDATNQSLRAARSLQVQVPDAGSVIADLVMTNRLEEGVTSGEFEVYPGFQWSREIIEVATNGFFRVDVTISGPLVGRPYEAKTSLYLWRPESAQRLPGLRR